MNRRSALTAATFAALSLGIALPAGDAFAQAGKGLTGTWSVVSVTVDKSGKTSEPFGPSPKGMFTFDGSHFSYITARVDLPKFAANSREAGTADENKAVVQGSLAYFGSYTVSEADKTLNLRIDGATFPNWIGQDQKRTFMISGDDLTLVNPAASVGAGTAKIVLKRASTAVTH